MRIKNLKEVYSTTKDKKEITPQNDPEAWMELIKSGKAPDEDMSLFKKLRRLEHKFGGKANIIKILRLM